MISPCLFRVRVATVQVLVVGDQGDTHGEEEHRAWLGEAGFDAEVAAVDDLAQSLIIARQA